MNALPMQPTGLRNLSCRVTRAVRGRAAVISGALLVCGSQIVGAPLSNALPADGDLIQPLPVIVPTPSNWLPKYPFPYDQTKADVTVVDINAEREMCQWFTAQYVTLRRQIDRLQFNRITPNGPGVISGSGSDWDYSRGDIQRQADIVIANIDQAVDYLAPRAQALTQSHDYVGDSYFPLFQSDNFYLLWQHLSNVRAGIESHQPDWFTGPSVLAVKRAGSKIERSHVCD